MDGELNFVSRTPGLRQVYKRRATDGFFPHWKSVDEINSAEDLAGIPEHMLSDIMRALIDREKEFDMKLSNALIRHLYDRDGPLVEQLYERMLHSRVYSDKKGSPSSSSSGSAQWMTMNN